MGLLIRGRLASKYEATHEPAASRNKRENDGYSDHGIAVCAPDWVRGAVQSHARLRYVAYEATGWDDHQDVVACSTNPYRTD
jgi:hypothetical protein